MYDTIIGKEKSARRREKSLQEKSDESVINAFKMFYKKNYSDTEWETMLRGLNHHCGVAEMVSLLKTELEKKGIKTEAWVRMSEKMFL